MWQDGSEGSIILTVRSPTLAERALAPQDFSIGLSGRIKFRHRNTSQHVVERACDWYPPKHLAWQAVC